MITRGETLVHDAALSNAATAIGCKLKASTFEFQQQLALALRTKRATAIRRQENVMTLRTRGGDAHSINSHFETLATLEERLGSFFNQASKEAAELQKDAIAQLSFQDEWFRCLNSVPFALALIAAFKIWFVPAMAILVPILTWFMPYLLLKYMFHLPIEQDQYKEIIGHLWSGSLPAPPYGYGDAGLPVTPSVWTPRSIFQGAIFLFSFGQSLVQPIMNAMHLYKTDTQFRSIGATILEVCKRVAAIRSALHMSVSPLIADFDGLDERQAFCLIQDQPERVRQIFLSAGRVEILWRLAQDERFHAVQFLSDKEAQLRIDAGYDLSIPEAVPASIHLSGNASSRHAVITGPNGGGKSSALRAVLQSVLLGHSYGLAPAIRAEMPRFRWIASGLQLRDTPGVLSMFETEVFFAARTLGSSRGPGLVLFDELFHSTNPPDANRTAEIFLRALWERRDVFSVVSTHNFGLIERAPDSVLPLCCPAKELPNGDIEYSFLLQPGTCKVSSVKKVWQRFGLSGATAAAPVAPENPTGQQEAK
jgi:hypothetical protein